MKKIIAILVLSATLSSCAILEEIMSMAAITKCEFSFHSAQDPVISGIDVARVQSFTDLTFFDGQKVVANILQKKLPFGITTNVEVKNPGTTLAAVNYIDWIAFIDDIQITTGRIEQRVEIQPNGGTAIVPMVTAVARLSPQTAEKPAQPATDDIASPPGNRPNHLLAVSNRSWLIPDL